MRITSKGQVTIPQAIREKAGLLPNTEVEFEYVDGQVILKPAGPPSRDIAWAMAALEKARGTMTGFPGWTTEQIMEFLRGED